MWDVFPIQCQGTTGRPLQTIVPDYPYTRYTEVQVSEWKDVPEDVKRWCQMIWKDEFDCQRTPIAATDLLAWIPEQATLTARRGYWVDTYQSKPMVLMNANYVHSMLRGHRLAEKMITSLAHEVHKQWNIDAFLFEIQKVPSSLIRRRAEPIASFQYVWVPTLFVDPDWRVMKPNALRDALRTRRGFQSATYPGMIGYRHAGHKRIVVLDSHDDAVVFESMTDVATIPGHGRYCRVFHPFGPFKLYVENMYFEPQIATDNILIP
jgi:hypothetical protein